MSWSLFQGDCRKVLADVEDGFVQTCVTSPPYFGLRDYGTGDWEGGDPLCDHQHRNPRADHSRSEPLGTRGQQRAAAAAVTPMRGRCSRCGAERIDDQIGLEPTPEEYVEAIVDVFRQVRRVLRDDGTVWLNLGDSYADRANRRSDGESFRADRADVVPAKLNTIGAGRKQKDLIGLPWMVAFALRADGWYLRSDIIWHKTNAMPESVADRPTSAHEHVFLLAKSKTYYYDAAAIREADGGKASGNGYQRGPHRLSYIDQSGDNRGSAEPWTPGRGRNKRNVWTVPTQPSDIEHFAMWPPRLIEPCILAGAPSGGVVLDPFAGTGTTGMVALALGRDFLGVELNKQSYGIARDRIESTTPPMFAEVFSG